MKLHRASLSLIVALGAACSSTTNAPNNPALADAGGDDASLEQDSSTIDSATADTGSADTGAMADTAMADTAMADTAMADTATSDVASECSSGATESEACGKCMTRTRTCTSAGTWTSWSACSSGGGCTPGELRVAKCGNCGTATEMCSESCTWTSGTCFGEGVCAAGAVETEGSGCTGKDVHTRVCGTTCSWGAWTCVPPKGWVDMATSPLAGRSAHTAVWTGSEMIVWGGGASLADGAAYSPATDSWRALPAPPTGFVGRSGHTAVWTGSQMIVWGGVSSSLLNDGAAYDPATNTWAPLPAPTLAGRQNHVAVWTGAEMLVWGGETTSFGALKDGAAYNPKTSSWRAIPAVPAGFGGRFGHSAVWARGKMIVFGGYDYFSGFSAPLPNTCAAKTSTSYCGDAATYDPVTNYWTVLTPPTPALDPRQRAAALAASPLAPFAVFWGGWGNVNGGSQYRNSGALFDIDAATWTTMPAPTETVFPDSKRYGMAAWTSGSTVSFWGGTATSATRTANGATFDRASSTWSALPTTNAPAARTLPTAVWTGSEAIVWGGQGASGLLNDGKIYRP